MNREIKFRGKRVDNGKWIYGDLRQPNTDKPLLQYYGLVFIYRHSDSSMFQVIPETVGQFTGLLDKNGKEIYEGDICLINDIQFDEEESFAIEWEGEMATFVLSSKTITVTFDVVYARQLEIIGNIHDNPELLEVSNA